MKIKAKETKTIETIEDIELDEIIINIRTGLTATGKDGQIYKLEPITPPFSIPEATITPDGIKFNCELTVISKR